MIPSTAWSIFNENLCVCFVAQPAIRLWSSTKRKRNYLTQKFLSFYNENLFIFGRYYEINIVAYNKNRCSNRSFPKWDTLTSSNFLQIEKRVEACLDASMEALRLLRIDGHVHHSRIQRFKTWTRKIYTHVQGSEVRLGARGCWFPPMFDERC